MGTEVQKKFHLFYGRSDCSRKPEEGGSGGFCKTFCTFFMLLESVNLKLFHSGFKTFNIYKEFVYLVFLDCDVDDKSIQ